MRMTPSFKELMISKMKSLGNPIPAELPSTELGSLQKPAGTTRIERNVAWSRKELSHGFEG